VILGVIAARGGSRGFPGKNLQLLAGRPLIVHSILAARESRLLDKFFVSTDDPAIAEVARAAGADVPFLRPAELATDDMPIWPVALHGAEYWEKESGCVVDTAIMLQATSPLRLGEDIDGCITRFRQLNADICASVVEAHDSPYFNMVEPVPGSTELVKPCTPFMLQQSRRQGVPPVYALNGAVFVYKCSVLPGLQSQFHVRRYAVYRMPWSRSVDIDGPEDLELAEWLLSRVQQL